jgi:hypothetical protein
MYCHRGVTQKKQFGVSGGSDWIDKLNAIATRWNIRASRAAGFPLHRAKAVATGVLFFGSFFWTPKERTVSESQAMTMNRFLAALRMTNMACAG